MLRLPIFILSVLFVGSFAEAKCISIFLTNSKEPPFAAGLTALQDSLVNKSCAAADSYTVFDKTPGGLPKVPASHQIHGESEDYIEAMKRIVQTAKPGDEIRIAMQGHGHGYFYFDPSTMTSDESEREDRVTSARPEDNALSSGVLTQIFEGVDPKVRLKLILDYCGAGVFLQEFKRPNTCGVTSAYSGESSSYSANKTYMLELGRQLPGHSSLLDAHAAARENNHPDNVGYDSLQAFLATEFTDNDELSKAFEALTSEKDNSLRETNIETLDDAKKTEAVGTCPTCGAAPSVTGQVRSLSQAPISEFERDLRQRLVGTTDVNVIVQKFRDLSKTIDSEVAKIHKRNPKVARLAQLRARSLQLTDGSNNEERNRIGAEIETLKKFDHVSTPELNHMYNEKQKLKIVMRSFVLLRKGTAAQSKTLEEQWRCLNAPL